jgi:hypothetical protein
MTIAPEAEGRTPRKGWIAGAFLLGLAIGLVLAWRVWPTQWEDTDPSDLRAEHQRAYVVMVADSYSVTGDANEARERLHQLVDEDNDWASVDTLIAATADDLEQTGNPAAALRVRRMRESFPLPIEPAAPPIATAEPEEAPSPSPRWALILVTLGIVALALALVIWLVTNEMRKREGTYESSSEQTLAAEPRRPRPGRALSLDPVPGPGDLGIHATERTEHELPRWDDAAFMAEEEDEIPLDLEGEEEDLFDLDEPEQEEEPDGWEDDEEQPLAQRPDLAPEDAWHVEESTGEPSVAATETVARVVDLPELDDNDLEPVEEPLTATQAPPAQDAAPLATFEATYRFGDDDFYHAFTIESPQHEFLGQCGIVISDVLGIEGAQLVDAFDLWLFETRGTRTMSKVVASEYAYTDDDLSAKLARKGELVLAEEGLVVTLQTESLRLVATIRQVGYREDQVEPDSVFDQLHVELVVEKIGA